jgi:hypothetical protein
VCLLACPNHIVPKSYRAVVDHGNVPRSTLQHRASGRRLIEEKAQGQQYLKPYEKDVIVQYLLQMSDLGHPIRIKFNPFNSLQCQPPATCGGQTAQAARQELDEGPGITPSRPYSTKSQRVGLEPLREKHI